MYRSVILACAIFLPLMLPAQQVKGLYSDSRGKEPRIEWYIKGLTDTLNFDVFRSPAGKDSFSGISTIKRSFIKNDTTVFVVFDTTLKEENIYRYYISVYLNNDTIKSELMFAHNMGYLSPPQLIDFTASPAKDRKAIELNWKLNDIRTVLTLSIYRSASYEDGYELIARLPGDATSYTDAVEISNEPWYYFIHIQDFFGYQPPGPRIHGFSTFAEKPFPPQDLQVAYTDNKMKIGWRGVGNNIIGYNLYRRVSEKAGFTRIISQYHSTGEWIEVTDTFRLPHDCRSVAYFCTAVSDGFLESQPGDTVAIDLTLKTTAPPPREVDVLTDADGNRLLIWTDMDTNPDVAGFNVYRKAISTTDNEYNRQVKLNQALLPSDQNYLVDTTFIPSGEYLYEIESVSRSGMPSSLKTGASVGYIINKPTLILSASQNKKGITLTWHELSDPLIIKINLYRQQGDGKPSMIKSFSNSGGEWTDTQTNHGNTYIYSVEAEYSSGFKQIVNEGFLIRRIAP